MYKNERKLLTVLGIVGSLFFMRPIDSFAQTDDPVDDPVDKTLLCGNGQHLDARWL